MGKRTDLMPPGEWVPNDFAQDDRLIVEGLGACKVVSHNCLHYDNLMLTVVWDDDPDLDAGVWPNLQWVNYEVREGG